MRSAGDRRASGVCEALVIGVPVAARPRTARPRTPRTPRTPKACGVARIMNSDGSQMGLRADACAPFGFGFAESSLRNATRFYGAFTLRLMLCEAQPHGYDQTHTEMICSWGSAPDPEREQITGD